LLRRPALFDFLLLNATPTTYSYTLSLHDALPIYFRWHSATSDLVLMDAPPPQEDCRPFVKIAKLLAAGGLHVPKVWAEDLSRGFLALSDLGTQTWLDVLTQDNADELFTLAIDALIRMQQIPVHNAQLPEYDEALLRRELQLFPDWYVTHALGQSFAAEQQDWWQQTCDVLVN